MIQADTNEMTTLLKLTTHDGDVPPYRIQSSVHVSGTRSHFLPFSGESSHVPRSEVNGSLVQMFRVFFLFCLLLHHNTCTNKQLMYHKLIDTQTSGTALYLATHSITELKKKSPQDETQQFWCYPDVTFQPPQIPAWNQVPDKCLPSSLTVCSFFARFRGRVRLHQHHFFWSFLPFFITSLFLMCPRFLLAVWWHTDGAS